MKPKSKPHVHYAATEDGVYFRTWTTEFVIKGPTIYQWVEQVLPYLTGERTLDELVAPLPEAQANFVRTLVAELVRRGVVVDATVNSEVPVSDAEQELYRQTLLFLEDGSNNGRERFRQFRDGQVLLAGAGLSFRAAVRSLIKMGLKRPVIVESDDAELERFVLQWKERDGELDVTRVADRESCEWLRGQAELPEFALYVSDVYDEDFVGEMTAVCAERNIPALIGTELFGTGVVGPLLRDTTAASWDCLLDRFVPLAVRPEEADSPIFRLMIGNIAALEAFKAITAGLDMQSLRNQAALIDPRNLEAKHHRLWPSPLRRTGNVEPEDKLEHLWQVKELEDLFWQIEEAEPLREFLGHLEGLKDDRLGVLNVLHPGDLWQIPFAHAQAVVRLPGKAQGGSLSVIASGEQIDEAMETAVREALTAYAHLTEAQMSGEPLPMDAAWSHGRDVQEWIGLGTLQALVERAGRKGEQLSELSFDLGAGLEQTYLKMLTLRYGLQVRLFAVDLGVSSAHLVRVWCDNQWIGLGRGRTEREALKQALLQALSNCQLMENHPEQMTAATAEAAVLPEQVGKREVAQQAETPAWTAWNADVQEQLLGQGVGVVPLPWLADPAPLHLGVLVGRIGLEEVSGR